MILILPVYREKIKSRRMRFSVLSRGFGPKREEGIRTCQILSRMIYYLRSQIDKEEICMKKYLAECIGTCTLVVLGCGTAMLVGCDAAAGGGYILTALAFGLAIVAMAYSIGNISGCHINPAVSLGVLLSGGMKLKEFWGYVVAQCVGALAGSGLLALIFGLEALSLAVNKHQGRRVKERKRNVIVKGVKTGKHFGRTLNMREEHAGIAGCRACLKAQF